MWQLWSLWKLLLTWLFSMLRRLPWLSWVLLQVPEFGVVAESEPPAEIWSPPLRSRAHCNNKYSDVSSKITISLINFTEKFFISFLSNKTRRLTRWVHRPLRWDRPWRCWARSSSLKVRCSQKSGSQPPCPCLQ